ncbi:MAG: polymerase family protein [Flavipsychrobacter sp.]|jgi:DNA polymerase (family 10)|nr:polymerase family protein [Flavipsychrobacter sp.]
MNNYEIADHFSLLSKLMDIHGEDSFKAKSYGSAAFNIERLTGELAGMSDSEMSGQKGIGASTAKKIRELLTTGKLAQLEHILAVTPPGILDMLQIKGLGPKKIAVIWKELGIESLGELEYACNENRLVALKGFGAKTQESVLQNIVYFKQNLGFHLWAEVEVVAAALMQQLQGNHPGNLFSLTGDMRRQNETVEFIEIVTDLNKAAIEKEFETVPDTAIEEEPNEQILVRMPGQPRVRFHLTEKVKFFHTLFMTTGSEEFIGAFLGKYKVPEAPAAEEAIFADNKLAYIQPMLRETAGILDKSAANTLSELIKPSDINAIIHSHSTWSDGVHTIEQMAKAAKDQGLEYLVISDHSQTAFYAGGLKPEQIAAQHQEVDALNAKLAPFKIFKSIESDILGDGSLDYTPQVLDTFDLVIASVHSNLKMSLEKAMDRVLAAVRNPYTAILGHPTGRLLLSRKGYPLDHKILIDTCAAHNVVIEINAHPRRLDIDWRWVEYAIERGVLLSIDPDAHSIEGFKDTYYGVMVAQKGGLTAQHNLSSFTLQQFETFLARYRAKRIAADVQQ